MPLVLSAAPWPVSGLVNGYGSKTLLGIALVGLGGGLGLHAARRWQISRRRKASND